ncbi:MAG: hypothetical protein WCO05_04505 [Candidatus Moraniibacteriota bacterium]
MISELNGVQAVMRTDHAKLFATTLKVGGNPLMAGAKTFTFCSDERFRKDGNHILYTATIRDLQQLIYLGEHQLIENYEGSGWNGFVPFAEGIEKGTFGKERMKAELAHRTTTHDVLEVFLNRIAVAVI